jgi:hypothetical protein
MVQCGVGSRARELQLHCGQRAMQHNRGTVDFIDQLRRPMPQMIVRASVLSNVLATLPAAANSSRPLRWHDRLCRSIPQSFPWLCPA